jgi:asparagine synthase (glutamine-hydrolysing)
MSPFAGVFEGGALSPAGHGAGGPAAVAPGRRICLFEGKIFNLDAVAAELGGGSPQAPEDLLLAAHGRWGEKLLGRLRGNFALLVHDPAERTALLACDQLGGRALFIHRSGPRLTFATEVRDLLRLLPSRPAPDEAAMAGWLAGFASLGDGTLYRDVSRLGAGSLLKVSSRGSQARRYWAPAYAEPFALSPAEAAAAARESLAAAVGRQLPAGAECGVLLSGGLDSSAVAALAGERPGRASTPRAYSAVFPRHPSIDESALIDSVVAELGLPHTAMSVRGGSMVGGALDYLGEWELPPATPNHFLWQPLLLRAAADGVGLMLDGEGGDELWHFSPYLLADRLRSGRIPAALRLARTLAGENYRGWSSLNPYLRAYGFKAALPAPLHAAARRRRPPSRYGPAWLTERSANALFDHYDPWAWKRLEGPRWWAHMADLLTAMRTRLGVGDYLRHRFAAAGLEGRHPMLDLDLIEFALRLPPTLAIGGDRDRPLLREAMAGSIPEPVRRRTGKSYFTPLFGDCLAERDLALVRKLLSGSPEVGRYADLGAVRSLLDEPDAGVRAGPDWSWPIWRLTTAECWLRSQSEPDFVAAAREECASRDDDWALPRL